MENKNDFGNLFQSLNNNYLLLITKLKLISTFLIPRPIQQVLNVHKCQMVSLYRLKLKNLRAYFKWKSLMNIKMLSYVWLVVI